MKSRGQGSGVSDQGVLGRRAFLERAGVITAAVGFGRLPRLARTKLGPIGIQLYTVRRELAKDVESNYKLELSR